MRALFSLISTKSTGHCKSFSISQR
jgi:hypothetical protein